MASAPKFRIDVDIHNLLMNSAPGPVAVPPPKGMKLPEPVFPRFPEKLSDPGPAVIPEKRGWSIPQTYRIMRGWLFPYVRSRVLPGDFHPITALSLRRVQMQPRLLVLLGLRQQDQRHDRRRCPPFD
jgi:hypothetical protein